jgi:hypothetical protein
LGADFLARCFCLGAGGDLAAGVLIDTADESDQARAVPTGKAWRDVRGHVSMKGLMKSWRAPVGPKGRNARSYFKELQASSAEIAAD